MGRSGEGEDQCSPKIKCPVDATSNGENNMKLVDLHMPELSWKLLLNE